MKAIKVFGERNCGTNYLERLLLLNFDIKLNKYIPSKFIAFFLKYEFQTDWLIYINRHKDLGWKHGIPCMQSFDENESLSVISITKNPYSFLLSLHKRPYHYQGDKQLDFNEFIKSPWQMILRDNADKRCLKNPIELWNLKNKAYREVSISFPVSSICLKYESFISDYRKEVWYIADKFGLKLKQQDVLNVKRSTKKDNKTFSDYLGFYKNELWREGLTKNSIDYINEYLDEDLMQYFDYKFI